MSDYLERLAQRTLAAAAPSVRPRILSPFEPALDGEKTRPLSDAAGSPPRANTNPDYFSAREGAAAGHDGHEANPSGEPPMKRGPRALPANGRNARPDEVSPSTGQVADLETAQPKEMDHVDSLAATLRARQLKQPLAAQVGPSAVAPPAKGDSSRPGARESVLNDSSGGGMIESGSPWTAEPLAGQTAIAKRVGAATESHVLRPQISECDPAPAAREARQEAQEPATAVAAPAAPKVQITIGRVEIRAVMPPAAPPPNRPAAVPAPRLSLDSFLKQSAGGRR